MTLCTLCATLTCAAVTCLICIFLPKQVFGLFANDPAVIELGVTFLRIFILHFIVSTIIGAFQAMVMGCGFVELGFLIGILDGVVCKIGPSWMFMNVFRMGCQGLRGGRSLLQDYSHNHLRCLLLLRKVADQNAAEEKECVKWIRNLHLQFAEFD